MACRLPVCDGDVERFENVMNINTKVLTSVKNTEFWQWT